MILTAIISIAYCFVFSSPDWKGKDTFQSMLFLLSQDKIEVVQLWPIEHRIFILLKIMLMCFLISSRVEEPCFIMDEVLGISR